ncbi:MAG TPA: hypothetical protein VMG98_06575 [Verrucomicrobiae bacterium]|nr:hypothetical protein [Verrucomicrobiae bacterium]
MKPSTTFTISRSGSTIPEFVLHEQCCYDYGRIDSVRACLREHLTALRQRTEALVAILATDDPERAEQLLLDPLSVLVTEVALRARSEHAAFEVLMKTAFHREE